jgi:hypothetical protein
MRRFATLIVAAARDAADADYNMRYNIGFVGPISVAAAYVVLCVVYRRRRRGGADDRTVPADAPALS